VRRKTLLLAGQLVCAVSAAAFGLVTLLSSRGAFLGACIVLRVINGLGSAAVDTASFAIISRWAPTPHAILNNLHLPPAPMPGTRIP
jgi:MFS family permease